MDWETVSTMPTVYRVPPQNKGDIRYRVQLRYTDAQGRSLSSQLGPFRVDIDDDDDGLIDIYYLEDLDAVRYQLDGSGYTTSSMAIRATQGCPSDTCSGYELRRDLDFATTQSYVNTIANKVAWTVQDFDQADDVGWLPIGDADNPLNTVFEGGGHTIFGLEINQGRGGFFGVINSNSIIRNIGIAGNIQTRDIEFDPYTACLVADNSGQVLNSHAACHIESSNNIGGLVGFNRGQISNSYAISDITAAGFSSYGGLVADNSGTIANSYAIVDIAGVFHLYSGGLVARNDNNGMITNSYAIADIEGGLFGGGIAGTNSGTITNSYAAGSVGDSSSSNVLVGDGSGQTSGHWSTNTTVLQTPTAPNASNPDRYVNWSTNNWDFGNAMSYPALRYTAGDVGNACALVADAMQPRCGTLLSGQPSRDRGLSTLFFARNGIEWGVAEIPVVPPFSSLLNDYDVTILYSNVLQLRPYAAIGNATILITSARDTANRNYFSNKRSGELSDPIPLPAENVPTTLTVVVVDTETTTYHFVVHRTVADGDIALDSTTPTSNSSVNEGAPIIAQVGGDHDFYYYVLLQGGVELVRGQSTASVLSFRISEDLNFEADATTRRLVYTLLVDNGSNRVDEEIELIVTKIDNGEPQLALNIISNEFSINSIVDDPDGVGSFTYQWQRRDEGDSDWIDVSDNNNYAAPFSDPETMRYRVIINHVDGQGNRETYSIGPFPRISDDNRNDLIDVYYLEDLNAMRYRLDGSSYGVDHPDNIDVDRMFAGCGQSGNCNGYELLRDLDFNTTQSYIDATAVQDNTQDESTIQDQWTVDDFADASDTGWLPIGSVENPFDSRFNGNNYQISNLQMNRDAVNDSYIALFAIVSENASIENVGLPSAVIEGGGDTGGLVAENHGAVVNSYAYGRVIGGQGSLGGLVGSNSSS